MDHFLTRWPSPAWRGFSGIVSKSRGRIQHTHTQKCVCFIRFPSPVTRPWVNALVIFFPRSHVNHLVRWGINYTATDPEPLFLFPPPPLFQHTHTQKNKKIWYYTYTQVPVKGSATMSVTFLGGFLFFSLSQYKREKSVDWLLFYGWFLIVYYMSIIHCLCVITYPQNAPWPITSAGSNRRKCLSSSCPSKANWSIPTLKSPYQVIESALPCIYYTRPISPAHVDFTKSCQTTLSRLLIFSRTRSKSRPVFFLLFFLLSIDVRAEGQVVVSPVCVVSKSHFLTRSGWMASDNSSSGIPTDRELPFALARESGRTHLQVKSP